MALSFYSEWNSFQNIKLQMTSFLQAEPEPLEELLNLHFNFDPEDTSLDKLFEQSDELLHPEDCNNVLQYLTPPLDPLETISPETFPTQNFEPWRYPKHQKMNENQFTYLDTSPAFTNEYVLDQSPLIEPLAELFPSLPEFPVPPSFTLPHTVTVHKSDAGLSVQSIAARQRRRKIAEKLQELGKLVPGGTKMNTAEMLQSAFKYVKFMQAQLGIIELIGSSQEFGNSTNSYELKSLLPSPIVQEKLYTNEKCLVPQEFVQKVASDNNVVGCKSSLVKEIERMMRAHNFPSLKGTNFV